jgi:hypothetical protein
MSRLRTLTAFSVGCNVAAVLPRLNVLERLRWLIGSAFRKQVGLFVTSVQQAASRRVALVPDDMANSSEAGRSPA